MPRYIPSLAQTAQTQQQRGPKVLDLLGERGSLGELPRERLRLGRVMVRQGAEVDDVGVLIVAAPLGDRDRLGVISVSERPPGGPYRIERVRRGVRRS